MVSSRRGALNVHRRQRNHGGNFGDRQPLEASERQIEVAQIRITKGGWLERSRRPKHTFAKSRQSGQHWLDAGQGPSEPAERAFRNATGIGSGTAAQSAQLTQLPIFSWNAAAYRSCQSRLLWSSGSRAHHAKGQSPRRAGSPS
jgi:hypothetical protein